MKVVGYVRVSTDEQARQGVSSDAQDVKINAYAVVKDWVVSEVIHDDGFSAKTLKRPGMERLWQMIKHGDVDVLMVYKLDRLSRSIRDLDALNELMLKRHVTLVSLSETIDTSTATGRAMMNMLAVFSQLEREQIAERTSEAMQHLKRMGKVYCREVFADRPAIERMQALRASGASYAVIADTMTREGIKTARGGQWHASTVHTILNAVA